jgi:hypothetical protein
MSARYRAVVVNGSVLPAVAMGTSSWGSYEEMGARVQALFAIPPTLTLLLPGVPMKSRWRGADFMGWVRGGGNATWAQAVSSTIVTPSPPSRGGAGADDCTSGWRARCSRTAARSAPVPLPCRIRTELTPESTASFR